MVARRQLLSIGLGPGAVDSRLRSGELTRLHSGVYAIGHRALSKRGHWHAAVLAYGDGTVLSHRSAASLWGLLEAQLFPVEVISAHGRPGRARTRLHRSKVNEDERRSRHGIPVTSVERTLLDLAAVADGRRLRRAFEEADRLGLLDRQCLDRVCTRGRGRPGVAALRALLAETRTGATRSDLEDRFLRLCRDRGLPLPLINASVLGYEVDAFWPAQRLVVELDGFAYHRHRAAFERDRVRDAALQAAGYRVLRLTSRALENDAARVVAQIKSLLVQAD